MSVTVEVSWEMRGFRGGAPVILVPADILRDLPIAKDWSDVADAASKNEELRGRVNEQIARLWTAKTLKDKDEIRRWALSGKDAFETLLEMLNGARPTAGEATSPILFIDASRRPSASKL